MKKLLKKIGTFFAEAHDKAIDTLYDIRLTYNTLMMFYFGK